MLYVYMNKKADWDEWRAYVTFMPLLNRNCESFLIAVHHTLARTHTHTHTHTCAAFHISASRQHSLTLPMRHIIQWDAIIIFHRKLDEHHHQLSHQSSSTVPFSPNNESKHTTRSEIIMISVGAPTFRAILTFAISTPPPGLPLMFPLTFYIRWSHRILNPSWAESETSDLGILVESHKVQELSVN